MIPVSEMGPREEFFSWTQRAKGHVLHFAAGRLYDHLVMTGAPLMKVGLTPHLVEAIMTQNGVELDHLDRISAERRDEPVVMADWGDGTHVIVDGAHRLLRRHHDGFDCVAAYNVPETVWREFLISGVPGGLDEWVEHLDGSQAEGRKAYVARRSA